VVLRGSIDGSAEISIDGSDPPWITSQNPSEVLLSQDTLVGAGWHNLTLTIAMGSVTITDIAMELVGSGGRVIGDDGRITALTSAPTLAWGGLSVFSVSNLITNQTSFVYFPEKLAAGWVFRYQGTSAPGVADPATGYAIFRVNTTGTTHGFLELPAQTTFSYLQATSAGLVAVLILAVFAPETRTGFGRTRRSVLELHRPPRTVTCPNCGGSADVCFQALDLNQGTPGVFAIAECRTCGLATTHPRRGHFELQDYPESYVDDSLHWGYLNSAYHSVAAKTSGSLGYVSALLLAGHKPGNLLDIGCGIGTYAHEMEKLGWNCAGVEPNPRAAEAARRRGVDVTASDFEHTNVPLESFDAVTLIHVLEHVPDPRTLISKCVSSLVPGGILLVAVPNFDSPGRRFFRADWYPLEVPRHLSHFTERSLSGVLRDCGVQIIGTFYDNRLGDVVQSVQNMFLPFLPLRVRKTRSFQILLGTVSNLLDLFAAPLLTWFGAPARVNIAVLAQKSGVNVH